MIKWVDDFLNGITQYRLMLYFLLLLLAVSTILSLFTLIPFKPTSIVFSAAFLTVVCWITNKLFAKIFKVPTNLESVYITALILSLIMTPIRSPSDLIVFTEIAFLSQAAKYFLVINRKHLFNPAAFGAAMTAIIFKTTASWWVGTLWMLPFVLLGGILIVRKMQRSSLLFSFLSVSLMIISATSFLRGNDSTEILKNTILESPLSFFAVVMLTEPLTTPAGRIKQTIYGGLVGLLFGYITPETALLAGNVFSHFINPKARLLLTLKEKIQIGADIYDFVFKSDKKIAYLPGQYLEWTLLHPNPDSRGVRRYFTIAAPPTEKNLRIGVKFYPNGSSYKKALLAMRNGDQIVSSQLAGDFTLPEDPGKKLCFIAGGIGITPFRSMTKYLLDTGQKRDIVLLYSNKLAEDIVYKEIFDGAKILEMKSVYVLTDITNVPKGWKGKVGYIDAKLIQEEVFFYKERIYYISGPHSMVDAFEKVLRKMGIPGNQIKVDFFPGYA